MHSHEINLKAGFVVLADNAYILQINRPEGQNLTTLDIVRGLTEATQSCLDGQVSFTKKAKVYGI